MALTDYTTIKKIRSESGYKPMREFREKIGVGDGTTVTFPLAFAGGAKHDVVVSRDQLGSVGDEDIDVYIGNVTLRQDEANYNLDAEEGTVTLSSAPANNTPIYVTYWHSILSDDEVAECISYAMDFIDRETSQSFFTSGDTELQNTDVFDGDGVTKSFRLSRGRIISLVSYDIDGVTSGLVEDTDYYLYPKEHRIVFETPPNFDNKNISITYEYGVPINSTVQDLATILGAIKAIGLAMGRTGKTGIATGRGTQKSYREANRPVSHVKILYERAEMDFKSIGFKVRVDGII